MTKLEFNAADARTRELRKLIAEADEPSSIHFGRVELCGKDIGRLVAALDNKVHRADAVSLIRDLVEWIVLTPNDVSAGFGGGGHGGDAALAGALR